MLEGIRVLDLSDERGQLCGHILASFGAEVIAIEPPGGTSSRALGPFWHDQPGPETSLQHWSFNRGKRSVVVDLTDAAGREALLDLVAGADVLVESFDPGQLDAMGLSAATLAERNPALVHVSITPFGSSGPKTNWAATDLTIAASSGQMWLTGDKDRPPLRIGIPQAFHHAAAEAASAVLIALYERDHHSGLGQHIDASAQHSLVQASQSMMLSHALDATPLTRIAGGVKVGPLTLKLAWPCKDGHVSVTFLFGAAIGPFTQNLMNWVHEEGFCDEATRDKNWIDYAVLIFTGQEPVSEYERIADILTQFFATKTKAELLQASFDRRLLIVPVLTIADVVESPQLADRGYWQDVDQGEVGTVRYPGAISRVEGPAEAVLRPLGPPPRLGADTEAVRSAPARVPAVPRAAAPAAAAASDPTETLPLRGLKVLDLMWVMAGPAASRVLADHGATVVRVESANRTDTARTLQPFRNDGNGVDDSGLFNNMNASKMGLALDLSKPLSREVVLDLVGWADVVLESFSPRAMRGWNLHYDALREVKPDVIMLSSCLMGQTGPMSSLAGYGTMAAAISGFFDIVGWPDRPPSGPFGAYTDYVAPKLTLTAVLAALRHREQTGQGCYLDLSQAEASLHLLSPILLDQTVNGRTFFRKGNDDDAMAPHGVYPAAGEERWIAVACATDAQWQALAGVVGADGLAGLSTAERLERRRELDGLVSAWTSGQDATAAMELLQSLGVPAHRVQDAPWVCDDPQLAHRGYLVEVPQASQGTTWVEGPRIRLSRTPGVARTGGPAYGEHLWDVLNGLLGYDDERIAEYAAEGIFE